MDEANRRRISRFFPVVGMLVILGIVVFTFTVIDSPWTARSKNLDIQRVQRLERIRFGIMRFYANHQSLPQSLDELDLEPYLLSDPESGRPFGFRILDADRYSLTAEFDLPSKEGKDWSFADWSHPAGEHSFEFSAQPKDRNGDTIPFDFVGSRRLHGTPFHAFHEG